MFRTVPDPAGSFTTVQPAITPNVSGWMSATQLQSDDHTASRGMLLGVWNQSNNGGTGSFVFHQLHKFYCRRCGMAEANAEAIPQSGYAIKHAVIPISQSGIGHKVEKYAQGCTVGQYSSAAGPSAGTLSDTATVVSTTSP